MEIGLPLGERTRERDWQPLRAERQSGYIAFERCATALVAKVRR